MPIRAIRMKKLLCARMVVCIVMSSLTLATITADEIDDYVQKEM
jgi:hypothetical protein